jgi:dolichyl-phosphate beta-glucosyltransferase
VGVVVTYLAGRPGSAEVLVVIDGSRDRTRDVVRGVTDELHRDVPVRLLDRGTNSGKGASVRHGMLAARGDLRLFSDADLSTPIEDMETLLSELQRGYDLVIGSRAHAQAEIRTHQPLYREGAGKLFNVLVRLVVGGPFRDTQCGFKLFRRETVVPILPHLQIDRWAFDVELIAIAQALGLKVSEVPVVWSNSPTSTVGLRQGAQAFVDLLRIRQRARRLSTRPATSRDRVEAVRGNH